MNTQYLLCDEKGAALAADLLNSGELVAIPTETVYGLAADAKNEQAVRRIFEVKGRPQDNPLIVHICDIDMWRPLVKELPEKALKLAKAFWPGPLTIILPKSDAVPLTTTAGMDSVAVRMPSHEGALAVIKKSGLPLAAPSANLSGSPSPTSAEHCRRDLDGKIPLVLDGEECLVGIESTVVSLVGTPRLLRPGAITAKQLSEVLGEEVEISHAVVEPLAEGEKPSSPGMKYKHYAPKAHIILVEGDRDGFIRLLESSPEGTWGLVFTGDETKTTHPTIIYGTEHDAASQAHGVFAALRQLDDEGAKLVYARCPDHDEDSLGVYNRLLRAAAFEVIKV
ncbi:MAG: threonylcarbamoyl-AMP synthase [Oscillospiraceae bacterium]|nr:threonylcarbamoyl-AMP synthase [Oscillospiraceae bacterium]